MEIQVITVESNEEKAYLGCSSNLIITDYLLAEYDQSKVSWVALIQLSILSSCKSMDANWEQRTHMETALTTIDPT